LAFISQTWFVLANMLVAHYSRWVAFLGGDVSTVGWVMSAGAIFALALRPWMGQWINRLGARNTWALGYLVFAVSSLGNLLLHDRLSIVIYGLRTGLVLGAAMVFASSLTYVTQIAPTSRRTEAIGVLGAGGFVGMLLGPFLGDLILGPSDRQWLDFAWLFIVAAIAALTPLVFLLFLQRPPGQTNYRSHVTLRGFVRDALQHWPGSILLVNIAFGICMTVPLGFLYKFIDDAHIEPGSYSPVGLFFVGYAGWGLTVRLGLRRLADQVGRRKVLLVGLMFMALGMFSFPWVDRGHSFLLILPGLICGTGHALMFHTMTALSLEPFPNEVRGTGSALSLMALDMGTVAGAPVLGVLAKLGGYGTMFAAIGAACLLVTLLYAAASIPVWRARRLAALLPDQSLPIDEGTTIEIEPSASN
jgi:MFS family permease